MLLGLTKTGLLTLIYSWKSSETYLVYKQHPPKQYKLLNFYNFCDFFSKWARIRNFHSSLFQMLGEQWDFTVVRKVIKHFKSLYGFWGYCLNSRNVSMDLEPCSRSITWSLFTLKTSHLVK